MTGNRGEGCHAYNLGSDWWAIALNSNPKTTRELSPDRAAAVSGRAQKALLRDLADAGTTNVVSHCHHARFSDGPHRSTSIGAKKTCDLLYQAMADLVRVGHNCVNERLTKQTNP